MPVQLRIVRMGMVCWRVRRQRCRTTHATHCLHPRMTWTSLDLRMREQQSCVFVELVYVRAGKRCNISLGSRA